MHVSESLATVSRFFPHSSLSKYNFYFRVPQRADEGEFPKRISFPESREAREYQEWII